MAETTANGVVYVAGEPGPPGHILVTVLTPGRPDGLQVWMRPEDLRPSKVKRSTLTPELRRRAEATLTKIGRALLGKDETRKSWADGFEFDMNPEREIRGFEIAANVLALERRLRPNVPLRELKLVWAAINAVRNGPENSTVADALAMFPMLKNLPDLDRIIDACNGRFDAFKIEAPPTPPNLHDGQHRTGKA